MAIFRFFLMVLGSWGVLAKGIVGASPPSHPTPQVFVSIPPLYMLVREIMQGVGRPHLIIPAQASPHEFSLKPSHFKALSQGGLLFWIGPSLEHGLIPMVKKKLPSLRSVAFLEDKTLTLLPFKDALSTCCSHNDHKEHKSQQNHNEHKSHKDQEKKKNHGATHPHTQKTFQDPHVWLSPSNAIAMARRICHELSQCDPLHEGVYQKNTQALIAHIKTMEQTIGKRLSPFKHKGALVFHNAYTYFFNHFGIQNMYPLTLNPEEGLKIRRTHALKKKASEKSLKCLFTEPQFQPKALNKITVYLGVKKSLMDPLGSPESSYHGFLETLTTQFLSCWEKDAP